MDVSFDLNGTTFVWDRNKAHSNLVKHEVAFETAATAFFDPFFQLEDASANDEARDALIGFDACQHLLYVVHIQIEERDIRIVSARKATREERRRYDQ